MRSIIFMLLLTAIPTGVHACELKHIPFGVNYTVLQKQFGMNAIAYNIHGKNDILLRATSLCRELPRNILLKFVMMDDRLIRVVLEDNNATGVLRTLAKDELGPLTNIPQKGEENKRYFDQVYSLEGDRAALYSFFPRNGKSAEYLELTTLKEQNTLNHAAQNAENPLIPLGNNPGGVNLREAGERGGKQ